MELVTALKESAVSRVPAFTDQSKAEGDSSSGTLVVGEGLGMGVMSRLAQATRAALAEVGPPPAFDPLALFMVHLEGEYGGFRRDQMQRI